MGPAAHASLSRKQNEPSSGAEYNRELVIRHEKVKIGKGRVQKGKKRPEKLSKNTHKEAHYTNRHEQ